MKKKIFMACAALVVSAAAVVGVKAYNYSQLSDLALANIEALSKSEASENTVFGKCGNDEDKVCMIGCPHCGKPWLSTNPGPMLYAYGKCTYENCNKYFDTRVH